ncbi:MAG: site-specific DNA-methyltransferase [Chlorobiales bacterium]|nr:site-specific DNA-methyltransferase [Chlorobiales bacterium]
METHHYKNRSYLSAIEAARFLNTSVTKIHQLASEAKVKVRIATSGQMRFDLADLKHFADLSHLELPQFCPIDSQSLLSVNGTTQQVFVQDSTQMSGVADESVHLMVTSPPYFNAKLYSRKPLSGDLGNIHDIDEWFEKIGLVWKDVFRVLQPGRKAFINIMNLPVSLKRGTYRTINLVGRTIDVCEKTGFVFKRDIVWQKTNGARAHFGTYPYPGGILINNTHEFILEFQKPERKGFKKYAHLTDEQKEASTLDKEFWISIKKSDVWVMKPEGSGDKRCHVAPFPYELPYRLIKAFSFVGETVIDPFLGSGTTLRAAASLQRNGIGYELNDESAVTALESLKNLK